MQILVTGPRGFIGTRLLPRLRDRKVTVVPYEGEIRDIASLPNRFDVVIHLAARAAREDTAASTLETMRTNVIGTLAVTEYARRFSCGVVFTSTCAVYDAAPGDSLLEEHSPLAPRGPNGLSKLLGEEILTSSARLHGFSGTILRLFNLYGPGQPQGYLVADVLHSIETHEPVRFRNPSAVLDFVYVDDVCEAICLAAERMPEAGVTVFNIGTGHGTGVLEVARTLVRLAGTGQELIEPDLRGDDIRVIADRSAAERGLGWIPSVDLRTGLAATSAAREKNV